MHLQPVNIFNFWTSSGDVFGYIYRADSRLAPSQWEASLQSHVVSHWLGANLESTLYLQGTVWKSLQRGYFTSCPYQRNVTKCCTCDDSTTVVLCAKKKKINNHFIRMRMRNEIPIELEKSQVEYSPNVASELTGIPCSAWLFYSIQNGLSRRPVNWNPNVMTFSSHWFLQKLEMVVN